jgi:predicted DCC family thiol-disulfide oxidoreductase YuxK
MLMNAAPITLLYDGACPICALEMSRLYRRDKHRRLRFVDISADGFDGSRYGSSKAEMMSLMHAVLADGRTLTGIDALHAAYSAVGLGWLWAPARWPLLRPYADALYARFARHRMRVSRALGIGCSDSRCSVPK